MKRWCTVKFCGGVDIAFHSASKFSKYLGVFPYVLVSRKLELSKFFLIWSLFLMFTAITLEILLILDPPIDVKKSFITSLLIWVELSSFSVTLIINLLWLHNSKERLNTALTLLNKVYDRLGATEINLSLLAPLFGLFMITIIATLDGILNMESHLNNIFLYISYYLTSAMIYAIALQLSSTLQLTEHLFKELRLRLPKTHIQTCCSIDLLIECHEILVTACEAVNQAYAPQLLLITLSSFVLVTGNSYTVLITNNPSPAILISWIILFAHLTWHIISACDATYTEAAEFDKILYRLVLDDRVGIISQNAAEFDKILYRLVLDDRVGIISQNMKVCMHFTNKRTVEFTACGFFSINYSTASSMVATACTYLVILIQMGGMKETPSS